MQSQSSTNNRLTTLISAFAALVVLLALVHWGGSATTGPLLIAGVAVLIAVIVVFGILLWWLYISPMPANRPIKIATRSATIRQTIAILMMISGLLFSIGALWDEVWHRTYGVGAAINDFFWRPHILIYISIGLVALFAFVGLWPIMQGRGDMRQRFRSEPLLGLLALACGFQVVITPLDPLWHQLYGLDLTAWSLPHLLLGIALTSVMLVAIAVQLSCIRPQAWRTIRRLTVQDGFVIVLLGLILLQLTQFGTTEWENLTSIGVGQTGDAFWQRPEWLYPVIIISLAAFVGTIALYTTRAAGSATLAGLTSLALRLILLTALHANQPPANLTFKAHLIVLPALIALDLWYGLRLKQVGSRTTIMGGGLAVVIATLTIGALIAQQILVYPRFNAETFPPMIIFGVIMGVTVSYAAAQIGTWLRSHGAYIESTEFTNTNYLRVMGIGLSTLVIVLLFVSIFIGTATPPIV